MVVLIAGLGDGEASDLHHFTCGRKRMSSDLTRPSLVGRQRKGERGGGGVHDD